MTDQPLNEKTKIIFLTIQNKITIYIISIRYLMVLIVFS